MADDTQENDHEDQVAKPEERLGGRTLILAE